MTYLEFRKLSPARRAYLLDRGEAVMSEPRPMNPAWLRLEGQNADIYTSPPEGMSSELPKLPLSFLASELESVLPTYKDSISITHNPHKVGEMPLRDWLLSCHPPAEFEDELAEAKALETGEVWVCHYYPSGHGALISLGAPTLAGLLEQISFWANEGN